MTKKIDFSKYAIFVDGVTSHPSKDYQCFIESVSSLNGKGANIELSLPLLAVGISAEGGEFMEIVKKMVFKGSSLGTTIIENILLLSWVTLCGT